MDINVEQIQKSVNNKSKKQTNKDVRLFSYAAMNASALLEPFDGFNTIQRHVKMRGNDYVLNEYKFSTAPTIYEFLFASTNDEILPILLETYRLMLQRLKTLGELRLVHRDICAATIQIRDDHTPMLCDFENCVSFDDVLSRETITRAFVPLEQIDKGLNGKAADLDDYVEQFAFLDAFFTKSYRMECLAETHKHANIHIATWDNFALSVLFLQLIAQFADKSKPFVIALANLLIRNISPCPHKRMTIGETVAEFDKLFTKFTDWTF
jgi:hypothetical protein